MVPAIVVGVLVLLAGAIGLRRRRTGYSVDQFARARTLTTEWARRAGADVPRRAEESWAQAPDGQDRPQD